MRKILFTCFLSLFSIVLSAQTENTNEAKKDTVFTFEEVDTKPMFPEGETAFLNYIQNNVKYPEAEKEADISGTCYVVFVIRTDGTIIDERIVKGVSNGPGLETEALRVVKAMPKWKPGIKDGKKVNTEFVLPIRFTLIEGRKKKKKKKE